MRAIDRLYKREETITRSVHIDEDLYERVQYLSENVYEASASKIINVCIENALLKNKGINFYKKPANTDSIYRSIVLRKSFYKELLKIKDNYPKYIISRDIDDFFYRSIKHLNFKIFL